MASSGYNRGTNHLGRELTENERNMIDVKINKSQKEKRRESIDKSDQRAEKINEALRRCCQIIKEKGPSARWVHPRLEQGETYDMVHLLSSPARDHLIRGNGDQVYVRELCFKHILLYFWGLSDHTTPRRTQTDFIQDLEELYANHSSCFEVVFVAFGTDPDAFSKSFANMPWLAIPHEDQESRDRIQSFVGLPGMPAVSNAIMFDPCGTVLQTNALSIIAECGPEGFPFSHEKIYRMENENLGLWHSLLWDEKPPCFSSILGDYLISPEGAKVPTSVLEGKTVGLYFFDLGFSGERRTALLLELWRCLEGKGLDKKFQIVFIAADRSSRIFFDFREKFKMNNPWYTLPSDGRRLSRIFKLHSDFKVPHAGYFIILKRDKYEPLSYFALNIFEVFRVEAYPFTLESAVVLAQNRETRVLRLDILFPPYTSICRRVKGVEEFLKPYGKRILVLFATDSCCELETFMPALRMMYNQPEERTDNWDIIYVPLDSAETLYVSTGMPWFICPFDLDLARSLVQSLFGRQLPHNHLPAIAAFGLDGNLVAKETNLASKTEWNPDFPFIKDDMAEEVCRELMHLHKWSLARVFP